MDALGRLGPSATRAQAQLEFSWFSSTNPEKGGDERQLGGRRGSDGVRPTADT
jgi:hypothetical protein